MPKISVNILTRNRAELLAKALESVRAQSYKDFEVVLVDDASTDETESVLKDLKFKDLKIIKHTEPKGIIRSRQEALEKSSGEFVAILDDDDQWADTEKLKKQLEFFETNSKAVLAGGGIRVESRNKNYELRMRPQEDRRIRRTMLFRNNFFTSTVMFKKDAAIKAGGFVKDGVDLAEDYDLWLRLGLLGEMGNISQVFALYRKPSYNKEKFKAFLKKQLALITRHRRGYKFYWLASFILKLRIAI